MKTVYMRQAYMGMIGDMKNLEQHFALMAKRGWMIDRIGFVTHRYRAVEPCKKRFFVDFLPQITAFDYPENEDAQDYRSICEESGWTFVAANKQFHVFCADSENAAPMPIHTDNKIQARIYLKACRKYEMPVIFFSLFMLWFFSPFGRGVELFLSNMMLFMMIGYCFFIVGWLWTMSFVIRWYIRTKKSAKNDLPMPTVNYRLERLCNTVFVSGTIAFLICVMIGVALEIIGGMPAVILLAVFMPLSGIGVGLWIRRQVDTKRRTRGANIWLSITAIVIMELVVLGGMGFMAHSILSSPPSLNADLLGNRPALTLNDVGVTVEPNTSNTRIKGTVAVPVDYCHWESSREGTVNTQIYRSVSQYLTHWLYDHYAVEFIEDFSDRLSSKPEMIDILTPEEAAFWGAEKGLAFYPANSNAIQLLLANEKTVLQLSAEGVNMDLDAVSQAVRNLWND